MHVSTVFSLEIIHIIVWVDLIGKIAKQYKYNLPYPGSSSLRVSVSYHLSVTRNCIERNIKIKYS